MKKKFSKLLIIALLLFVAFLTPKAFAQDQVYVEEIILLDHSANAVEKSAPTKDGLNIAFDLSFSEVADFAKYKIIVNNPTDTSYELNKNIDFRESEYIEYKTEFEDDNNIINGHQKLNLYITITYKNLVPAAMLTEGKLIENNTLSLNFSNDNVNSVMNPSTIDRVVLYVFTLVFTFGFSLIFYKITKNKKYLSIFVLGLLLIPFEAYALDKLEFKIETNVVIEKKYSVNYVYSDTIKTSEKENYKLYGDNPCVLITDTEYEYCSIAYTDPVLYAKGDDVSLLGSIENRYLNSTGELETQNIIINGINQSIKLCDSSYYNFLSYSIAPYYIYDIVSEEGHQDDSYQNIFNDESIIDYIDSGSVLLKAPGTFKMQNHDMYLIVALKIQK